MAVYRARWIDASTGLPMVRLFNSKREANAFRDLPRDNLVFVAHVKLSEGRQP